MKKIICVLSLIFVNSASAKIYGESFTTPKGGAQPVAAVMGKMAKGKTKSLNAVAVKGEISSVCQAKGCCITLKTKKGLFLET